MNRYGDMAERSKRFVMLVHYYGHGFDVSRKNTSLPERLAMAIRILFFGNEEGKSKLPEENWESGISLCLKEYREYYRQREAAKKLAEG